MTIRIGQGFDAHRFKEGGKLILGGVDIPHTHGMEAHSDGDVLIHALCDALLGALGEGDIGRHFPDTDQQFKGIDSRILLRNVVKLMREKGFQLGNADMTIIAQAPKMAPHLDAMKQNLVTDLQTDLANINIKATTTEQMGFTGRGEGISAMAVVVLLLIV